MKCRLTRVGLGRLERLVLVVDVGNVPACGDHGRLRCGLPACWLRMPIPVRRVGSAGQRDLSALVCRPVVRSVWSGSATTIPSMRRPASSTATRRERALVRVAVPAATERIVAALAGVCPEVRKPAFHHDHEDRQIDGRTIRHVAEKQVRPGGAVWSVARWPRGSAPGRDPRWVRVGWRCPRTRRTPPAEDRSPGPARRRTATPRSATADGPAGRRGVIAPSAGTSPRRT